MESNNKPSTSRNLLSDSSDDDDERLENMSTEEICLKIKMCRNLCFGNKINVSNAFDIDMIGYFYSWLEKKKSSIFDDNDVTSFQEISDYLEASAKVYSYRVDNLTETTSRLVEQFKAMNYKKSTNPMDDNNAPKIQKPRRQRTMLTTSEKLRRKPNENGTTFNPDLINHTTFGFNCNELFSTGRPSSHLLSMYSGKTLAEEMKDAKDRQKEFDEKKKNETIQVDRSFLHMMDEFIKGGAICPEFKGFIAERDKVDDSKEDKLDGIEYRFDPNIHTFQNNSEDSMRDDNVPDNNELDPNSNDKDKDTSVLDGLLECIDNVDRDYSFFNPKLLANWKGPKAWKAQAMMKALKSCTPKERKEIVSNIDECTQQNIKTNKKRNQVKHDKVKINWLEASQINEIFENNIKGKEQILARTLQKWDPLDHISDTQTIDVDIKYKFDFLQYIEIKPDWWVHKNRIKDICSEASNSCQNINDCGESIVETSEPMEIDNGDPEQSTNENDEKIINYRTNDILDVSVELNSEDEDIMGNIKSESRMDIGELKKEISDIIDEECVETDLDSEWSSKLSFFNLLRKLRINERDGLSIPIVFVGLLHLANERGLRLLEEHCTINDMEETFITKPMK
ncbi:condensin complex subunit 2-like [Metopolophium dirhodum]|uniref:condensin complex subunit 2-like n=1 Tax=Metopolophium dirhodum TaxID=44670 RepID=UPI00298FD7AB|nr:condensin complex subunit 2-like [Metopolophium dirhodum]